jgi:hypothetical protein
VQPDNAGKPSPVMRIQHIFCHKGPRLPSLTQAAWSTALILPIQGPAMKLIDFSLEIYRKMPRLPNHPMIITSAFTTHEEKRVADGYSFSSAVTALNMRDHSDPMSTRPYISTRTRCQVDQ